MASFEPQGDDSAPDDDDDAPNDDEEGTDAPLNDDDDGQDGDDPDEGDDDDAGEEGADEIDPAAQAPAISDDTELEVTINGEAQKFTIGSLKRLAGQEASLTRKSQEAELVGARAAAGLQAAIAAIAEDLTPYQNIDWLVAQQQMDPETFQWHRENAAKLDKKYRDLLGAAQGVEETFNQRRQSINAEAAREAVAELTRDIPGWSDQLYGEILAYGAAEGLDADDLASVTNPKVLKIIRKAMLHDKAEKVVTQKVKAAPPKVIKGSNRSDNTAKQINTKKAEKRLATSGSDDDAMAVLMGRWA